MTSILCPSCGEMNREGATVCIRCEMKLPLPWPAHSPDREPPAAAPQLAEVTILPTWLTTGMMLVIVGGVLIFAGYMARMAAVLVAEPTTPLGLSLAVPLAVSLAVLGDALLGLGFLGVVIGWVVHHVHEDRSRR